MDDIRLEDEPFEPFEPFESYEDFADQMMQEAERQDQLMQPGGGSSSISSATAVATSSKPRSFAREQDYSRDALPEQRDFLGMFHSQAQATDQELQRVQEQRQQQQQQQRQQQGQRPGQWKRKQDAGGAGTSRPIGSVAGAEGDDGAAGDLAAVKVTKKRVKLVRLDNERLLDEKYGFPLLRENGKRFKVKHTYRNSAEKNANAKQNLENLMRLYQTWAHNLFPKSTLKDFISQAEAKCRERQMKATMNGWRDAYWDEIKEKKNAKEEAERAEQEALDRQNGVWDDHEKERSAGTLNQDSMSGDGGGEGPSSALFMPAPTGSNGTLPSTKSAQRPKARPVASLKGKEKAIDNPSAAMRMAISDDEDEGGRDDYEEALKRMRESMNLDDSRSSDRRISLGQGVGGVVQDKEETRKNEIDVDNYNSEVEDDEEEDAPLFTHRALQMMGGMKALERPVEETLAANKDETHDKTIALEGVHRHTKEFPKEGSDIAKSLQRGDADEEDEEDGLSQRRPMKGRRAIVLDDSDDE
ncbi:hypothetical protein BGZ98_007931 [Dissophora globulifera]|nr:hypothetical protein BGZ98_007931 [Dissophora globulifera]